MTEHTYNSDLLVRIWRQGNWSVMLSMREGHYARVALVEGNSIVYLRTYAWHDTGMAEKDAETFARFGQSAQKENAA